MMEYYGSCDYYDTDIICHCYIITPYVFLKGDKDNMRHEVNYDTVPRFTLVITSVAWRLLDKTCWICKDLHVSVEQDLPIFCIKSLVLRRPRFHLMQASQEIPCPLTME